MTSNSSLVSIVVPTYKSASFIAPCLDSIKKQTYPNIELIVVDNHSTDDTIEIASKYTPLVFTKGPERTFQKNFAISKASGAYIFFVDSDMTLDSHIVEECVDAYDNHHEIGGICIPERSVGEGYFVALRDFERSFYEGSSVESARFFRLEDVIKVGGFEEDLIFFEESLLPQKIESLLQKSCKHRINSYIDHHEGEIHLDKWLKKKFYYGRSLDAYKAKVQALGIKKTQEEQMSIIHRYMIFVKDKRFYTKPHLALGVLGLKTLEFASGACGLLWSKFY